MPWTALTVLREDGHLTEKVHEEVSAKPFGIPG